MQRIEIGYLQNLKNTGKDIENIIKTINDLLERLAESIEADLENEIKVTAEIDDLKARVKELEMNAEQQTVSE